MKIEILRVAGIEEALLGLALNKLQPFENMGEVADKLCKAKEGSHKKFLRQIQVWLKIEAPFYWWCEFDTYKIGVTRNSSSIMHKPASHLAFDKRTDKKMIALYSSIIELYKKGKIDINVVKANTPSGVYYQSIVNLNYQSLQTIYKDRKNHRLADWKEFCKYLEENLFKINWVKG